MIAYVCGPFTIETMKLTLRTCVADEVLKTQFEKEIIWSKASESVIEFWHGGRLLKTGSTFNDYYGFMTSQKGAIEEAKRLAKAYDVTRDSSLAIVVRTEVHETPYFKSHRCEKSNLMDDEIRHQLEYAYDQNWYTADGTILKDRTLSPLEITWDSRKIV